MAFLSTFLRKRSEVPGRSVQMASSTGNSSRIPTFDRMQQCDDLGPDRLIRGLFAGPEALPRRYKFSRPEGRYPWRRGRRSRVPVTPQLVLIEHVGRKECRVVLATPVERFEFIAHLVDDRVVPEPDVFTTRTDWTAPAVRAVIAAAGAFMRAAEGDHTAI